MVFHLLFLFFIFTTIPLSLMSSRSGAVSDQIRSDSGFEDKEAIIQILNADISKHNRVEREAKRYNVKVKTKKVFSDLSEEEKLNVTLSERNPEWITLLMNIPLSVILLGQLLVLSSQKDFTLLNENSPKNINISHIKFPESFRVSLIQVSEHAWRAFLSAHTNMHRIEENIPQIPNLVNIVKQGLSRGNEKTKKVTVKNAFDKIMNISLESAQWAAQVETNFGTLAKIIHELLILIQGKRGSQESDLEQLQLELAANEETASGRENITEFMIEEFEKTKRRIEEDRKNYDEQMAKIKSQGLQPHQIPIIGGLASLLFKMPRGGPRKWTYQIEDEEESGYSEKLAASNINNSLLILDAELNDLTEHIKGCLEKNKTSNCDLELGELETKQKAQQMPYVPEDAPLKEIANESEEAIGELVEVMKRVSVFEARSLANDEETNDTLEGVFELTKNIQHRIQKILEKIASESWKKADELPEVESPTNDYDVADTYMKKLLRSEREHAKAFTAMMASKDQLHSIIVNISGININMMTGKEMLTLIKQAAVKLEELKQSWSNVSNLMGYIASRATVLCNKFEVNLETMEAIREVAVDRLQSDDEMEKDEILKGMEFDKEQIAEKTLEMNQEAYYMYTIAHTYVKISNDHVMSRLVNLTSLAETRNVDEMKEIHADLKLGAADAERAIISMAQEHEKKFKEAIAKTVEKTKNKKKKGKGKVSLGKLGDG